MKNKNNIKLIIVISVIAVAVLLAVLGNFILPDILVMQITASGNEGTTMPKAMGLILPVIITVLFAVMYYKEKNNEPKYILLSLLGVLMQVITFIFNL